MAEVSTIGSRYCEGWFFMRKAPDARGQMVFTRRLTPRES